MSEKIEAMRTIADWVTRYRWRVYYNQKNLDGYPTFHSKGSNAKPDMLVTRNGYSILIEVKPGKDHKEILDGVYQVLGYAGEYYTGRVKYRTNRTIPINAFILASSFSPYGYLYGDEGDLPYLNYTALKNLYDMKEKPVTCSLTRFLWRQWHKGLAAKHYEDIRKGTPNTALNPPPKPVVGVLVAKTYASNNQVSPVPWIYVDNNEFNRLDRLGEANH